MKNINKYLIAILSGVLLGMGSCETTELDITDNPNALVPSQANPDFLLTSIQEDFARHLEGTAATEDNFLSTNDGLNEIGMELVRTAHLSGRNYQSTFQGNAFDDEWTNVYRGILADIVALQPLAEEAGLVHHIAIAKFIEAYVITSMVDFFGDIPYSEAILLSEGIQNPVQDAGQDIYNAAISLLDEAISNFRADAPVDPVNDFFYDNDYDKWELAANTLKLKLYLQTRLVDSNAAAQFDAIISSGNYIQDTEDDFQWAWPASSASNPDTRHPRYGINYASAGATDYSSNWLMNLMDTTDDPRIRYYYYRQATAVPGAEIPPDEQLLQCSLELPPPHYTDGGFTFCWLPNGYWGRDHGDNDGTPPDGLLRTTWGVYPAGGRFDDSSFTAIAQNNDAGSFGGNGVGISPILSAFMVDFYRAEMALASGDEASAESFLQEGLNKQIAKVQSFGALDASADLSLEPSAAEVTSYIGTVIGNFNAADANGKWNVLGEQFLISFYGNGVDPYNFYRRTGFPTTVQPNRETDPGQFMRSMYYPAISVNSNSSVSQKSTNAEPVFWDNTSGPVAN
ncbi:SusD/RagB family nutrient-binding outer membrane lipoprotein [Flagellimonas nanhaiensis]|uniref:SusD/RagB family nutrient-binding outer membrane lipoprotein n=1 Tax=Flagellimonas nanhaiensis TaxID=2292706 RepID=A0A371JL72_9FLAO|nr:SusD/RagB family nutrient-binding outer membrane lipoprotein [Allomuricauda nanhaiensis]RDY57688.1 SusD/RagB family nutrient-binding outer membrane lipoprotein [Allomuricauda nanhaiensis]